MYVVLSLISYSTTLVLLRIIIHYYRIELANVFIRVYTYLSCNDNTVVLAVTNTASNDPYTSDTDIISRNGSKIEIPYTVPDVADSKDLVAHCNAETPSDEADSKDFVTQPFPKMDIQQRCPATKPPDMPPPAPHTFPRPPDKGLVSHPFGVNPYAIVNLEKVRNLAMYLATIIIF